MLVDQAGLVVFGPAMRADAGCPNVLALPANAAATVKRAVALAMPQFEGRLELSGEDPRVAVGPAVDSRFSPLAGGCGPAVWARSMVASVFLPHVGAGASLSQHTFAVGRVRQGWVLWDVIH